MHYISMRQDVQNRNLTIRAYRVKRDTIDMKGRSIEAILATEQKVLVADMSSWEIVEEILLMTGCQLPDSRQIPLLDSHDRSTIAKQLGSVRDLRTENGYLLGRKIFSKSPPAEHPWQLTKEGHSVDNSIGYAIVDSKTIERGQTAVVNGQSFTASEDRPLRVVTGWLPRECSVVAVPADSKAKNRLSEILEVIREMKNGQTNTVIDSKKAVELERERVDQIMELAGDDVPGDIIQRCIRDGKSIEEAKALVLDAIRNNRASIGSPGIETESIQVGQNRKRISLADAAADALAVRAGITLVKLDRNDNPIIGSDGKFEKRQPHIRIQEFINMRLTDIARTCLKYSGIDDAWQMGDREVIRKAVTLDRFIDQVERGGVSTFTLPTILGDTLRRSLLASYTEYPKQWTKFAKKTTTPDFREITRARLGELDNLEQVGEGGEYRYATIGESKEKYTLAKYGKIFGVTFEQLLADDLNSLKEIPTKLGQTAVRLEDVVVFAVLTANATMDDGVVLFHADHANLGSGAALSITSLDAMRLSFRKQKGVNGTTLINIEPKILIVPAAIEGVAEMLLSSEYDPDTANKWRSNPWKGKLELCVHPLLDSDSATAWYGSATPGHGGIEICFLESEQTPALERQEGFEDDTLRWRIRHIVAAAAIDYRALYKNPGA